MTISGTTTVNILGNTASQPNAGDLTLSAVYGGTTFASIVFSVGTTGACTATWVAHTGDGGQNCPTGVSLTDTYTVQNYCNSCQFSCTPVNFDSTLTFPPGSCNLQSNAGITGGSTQNVQMLLKGNFDGTDCNWHYVQIKTIVTDIHGVITPYTGQTLGLRCNKDSRGFPCP
jgi:hypothetical protein